MNIEEERKVLNDVCQELINEKWISNIIDSYVYHYHEEYFENLSQIKEKYWTKFGEKYGEYISYYKTGEIFLVGQYINDLKEGEWKEYFEDGEVAQAQSYKNNVLNGKFSLYENKKLYKECNYVNGFIEGIYKIFGFYYSEIIYNNGIKIEINSYNKDGTLVSNTRYDENKTQLNGIRGY